MLLAPHPTQECPWDPGQVHPHVHFLVSFVYEEAETQIELRPAVGELRLDPRAIKPRISGKRAHVTSPGGAVEVGASVSLHWKLCFLGTHLPPSQPASSSQLLEVSKEESS